MSILSLSFVFISLIPSFVAWLGGIVLVDRYFEDLDTLFDSKPKCQARMGMGG